MLLGLLVADHLWPSACAFDCLDRRCMKRSKRSCEGSGGCHAQLYSHCIIAGKGAGSRPAVRWVTSSAQCGATTAVVSLSPCVRGGQHLIGVAKSAAGGTAACAAGVVPSATSLSLASDPSSIVPGGPWPVPARRVALDRRGHERSSRNCGVRGWGRAQIY